MDKLISVAIEGYVKNKFGRFFQNGDFKVDLNTAEKSCRISAMLAGETDRVEIFIKKFGVESGESGAKMIFIEDVSASRAWLEMALSEFLKGKRLKMPSMAASLF